MGTSPVRWGAGRAILAAALVLAGVAVMFSPAGAAEGDASAITITQTPSGAGGPCVPPPLGLTYTTDNTAEVFTLRITAASPPCSPIEAKAVVYAMPGNGEQWPQTLSEVVPFTISEAGVTEVVFAKGCNPVQFDVLTGETPEQISPLGAWHGPLLFPFDTATSLQWFGDPACNPTTTTASTTTTSTPEVNGSTTIPGSSTTQPEVAGVTTVPAAGAAAEVKPAQLALTGTTSRWGALLGSWLIAAGAVLLVVSRRRSAAEA
jgi:LPXTG-motif cell wall-anchored protein